jgi:hypothetical protein
MAKVGVSDMDGRNQYCLEKCSRKATSLAQTSGKNKSHYHPPTMEALKCFDAMGLIFVLPNWPTLCLVQGISGRKKNNTAILDALNEYREPICRQFWEEKKRQEKERRREAGEPIVRASEWKFTKETGKWVCGKTGGGID